MEFRHRRGSAHGRSWAENDKDMAAAPVWATALNRVSASCGCRSGSIRGRSSSSISAGVATGRWRQELRAGSPRKGRPPAQGPRGLNPVVPPYARIASLNPPEGIRAPLARMVLNGQLNICNLGAAPPWARLRGQASRSGIRGQGGGRLRAGRASPPWRCSAVEAGLDRLDGAGAAAPPVGAPSLPSWPARR